METTIADFNLAKHLKSLLDNKTLLNNGDSYFMHWSLHEMSQDQRFNLFMQAYNNATHSDIGKTFAMT